MTALGALACAAALLVLPRPRVRVPSLLVGKTDRVDRTRSRAMVLASTVAVGLALAVLAGGLHALCAAIVVGATVVRRRKKAQRRRSHRRELDSLVAGLDVVIGELRVGSHPALACASAAADCTGSVALAFGTAAGRARLGGDACAGLLVEDSPVRVELSRLSAAWHIADTRGLGLADLLGAARQDLLGRSRFRDRTEASLAGARATGTVLSGLPVLGVILGQFMGASPIGVLFGGGLGGVLLVLGSMLACAGLMWTDAITEKVCR
ncbi:type ii secretion system integral membrane subunit [Rhodococcus sp. H36-A4]|nr:type ii secretion system integral membrane subunit [Rhodococcus sp. H36-A4]MCZ4077810.1 type ii secretion system integral membrane subunit [Rhodococcus sp. H36-A4]